MTQRIVVGVDGSPAATAALAWAAGEARLRRADLVACTVLDRPEPGHPADGDAAQPGRTAVEESAGGYPVTVWRRYGDPAAELVAAADADTDLLVVGSRGRGRLTELVLGSVSRACLAHARCPVVVVHPEPGPAAPRGRVVVGVDGSGHSRQALRAAAEEARLRHATLDAVHAVHWDAIGTELLTPTVEQLVEWGRKLVAGELAATGVAGRPMIVPGHAIEVLVRESAGADLLVLSSRGHNPLAGLLLGSTSEGCARHARCPVLVTRAAGDRQPAGPAGSSAPGGVSG